MITLVNIILLAFLCYILAIQIDSYNRIVTDKFRFKYFALRDRMAMLVIEGKLEEESWEYKHIIDAINFHIKAVETVSMTRIANFLINYHMSEAEERVAKCIEREIRDPEMIRIMERFFEITQKLLYKNSKSQIYIFRLVRKLSKLWSGSPDARKIEPIRSYVAIENTLDRVREHKNTFSQMIESAH